MGKVTLPIANGFYESPSKPLSAQECVNLYPNIPQAPSLSQESLFGTPGLNQLATSGTTASEVNRGSHVKNGIPYFVNGETLYKVERTIGPPETFATVSLGTVTGEGRVSMADNGTQLMIVAASGNGYIYNEDAGIPFQAITDTDFTTTNGVPQKVVYIDGYFLVTTNSKKFKISSLNDGLTWSALDFGTAEADPDDTVAPHVHQNQLYIFGSETYERFQNVGGAAFPFRRVSGGVIDKGLAAKFGIVETNSSFVFLGGGPNEASAVWQSAGGAPTKISTTAIDNAIQEASDTDIQNAFMWTYALKGAFFVGLTVGLRTFVYDQITQRWHERKSFLSDTLTRYRVNSMVAAYGRILVGDSVDGRIGEISENTNEYGENIYRSFATQPFENQMNPFFVADVELTIESGVGTADTPDPQITMDYSDDGRIFIAPRTRSMGKIGEYFRRCIWRRGGRIPRFRVFRWTMTDKVVSNVLRLEADFIG